MIKYPKFDDLLVWFSILIAVTIFFLLDDLHKNDFLFYASRVGLALAAFSNLILIPGRGIRYKYYGISRKDPAKFPCGRKGMSFIFLFFLFLVEQFFNCCAGFGGTVAIIALCFQ